MCLKKKKYRICQHGNQDLAMNHEHTLDTPGLEGKVDDLTAIGMCAFAKWLTR